MTEIVLAINEQERENWSALGRMAGHWRGFIYIRAVPTVTRRR
jgi:hypothetical protein